MLVLKIQLAQWGLTLSQQEKSPSKNYLIATYLCKVQVKDNVLTLVPASPYIAPAVANYLWVAPLECN